MPMRSLDWGCADRFTTASVHAALPSVEDVVSQLLLVLKMKPWVAYPWTWRFMSSMLWAEERAAPKKRMAANAGIAMRSRFTKRSEEHTSELQSLRHLL